MYAQLSVLTLLSAIAHGAALQPERRAGAILIPKNSFADYDSYWLDLYPGGKTDHNGGARMDMDHVAFSGGNTITITAEPVTGEPPSLFGGRTIPINYRSGAIHSKIDFKVTKGGGVDYYAEVNAPIAPGTWPAWWVSGANKWPPEIDMAEWMGDGKILFNTWNTSSIMASKALPYDTSKWHSVLTQVRDINGVDVKVTFIYDGVTVAVQTGKGYINEPMHMIINYQMEQGGVPGPKTSTTYSVRNVEVGTYPEWLEARKALLQKEKELTKLSDDLAEKRRQLPLVKVDADYTFKGPDQSTLSLSDLFGDKKQLIVYHFMFGPDQERGCKGCAFVGEHIPDLRHLRSRDTAMVCVSRAPFEKIDAWKRKIGWEFPWYSSEGSKFNYDFHATQDESVAPVQFNFDTKEELVAKGQSYMTTGETPGLSVFFKQDGEIYHTYSTYARGLDGLLGTFQLLDMTPLGRQDAGPDGPAAFKLKYEYGEGA
ncbi:uncharacterized protein DNG_07031 [Cephalotrichum gorgonifer]|uniref:GH16 domain-containing protein n=1 Tax=Cephalotrichum gorgonifer TaxID=2041049 RepID=A0AAE8N0Y6_9PEZI|nr:uncharacterized protein DNG_07031 [Cephalotrichum gorgonifer]